MSPVETQSTPSAALFYICVLKRGGIDPVKLIDRHVPGDFGEVGQMGPDCLKDDGSHEHSDGLALNSLAVVSGDERILSGYRVMTV